MGWGNSTQEQLGPRHEPRNTRYHTRWWFQPSWKICCSNSVISCSVPKQEVKVKNCEKTKRFEITSYSHHVYIHTYIWLVWLQFSRSQNCQPKKERNSARQPFHFIDFSQIWSPPGCMMQGCLVSVINGIDLNTILGLVQQVVHHLPKFMVTMMDPWDGSRYICLYMYMNGWCFHDVRNVRCVRGPRKHKNLRRHCQTMKILKFVFDGTKKSAKIRAIFKVSHQTTNPLLGRFFFRQSSHHGCQVSGIFVGQADKLDHKLSENFTPSWSIGGPGFFHNDIPSNLPHDFWSTQSSNPPNQKNPQARLKPRLPMTITGSKNQCSFATDVTGIQIWTLAKFWPQASMGDDLPPSTPVTSVDMSYTITTSQKKNM